MNHGKRMESDAGVAVLFAIPLKELLAEGAANLDAAEAIREIRVLLHRSELAFGIRIVSWET
jgi:hypothetical protein